MASKKKSASKKAPAKKAVAKKTAAKKATKKATAKKAVAPKVAAKKAPAAKKPLSATAKKAAAKKAADLAAAAEFPAPKPKPAPPKKPVKLSAWEKQQQTRLLEIRDSLVDTMDGVAQSTLRSKGDATVASAFGQHQADAGSDSYDRDFALGMLSKEQDELYEIDEALERLRFGTYGVCETSGKKIPKARLEAIPWARFTVECQQQVEREQATRSNGNTVRSVFGLG